MGDYDNDQDVDLVISGFDASDGLKTFIYNNVIESGSFDFKFEKSENTLGASRGGSINYFDMENDGDLDIIITGTSFNGDVFEIYENKVKENINEWPKLETSIPGIRSSKVDFGDFNGDGYYDLLYSGIQSGFGKISQLREFNLSSKNYVESSFDIGEIVDADVEFGDIDGDGDLDFVLSGTNKENDNYHTISTFLNVRTESAEYLGLPNNNADDIKESVTLGSRNTAQFVKNNPPDIKLIMLNLCQIKVLLKEKYWLSFLGMHQKMTLLYQKVYLIRLDGTSAGNDDIISANASDLGFRTVPSKGNAEHNLKWKLALSPGTYFWAVQAADASFVGSLFSEEAEMIVSEDDIILKIDNDKDGVYDSQDNCPDTPPGTTVDTMVVRSLLCLRTIIR